MIDDRRHKVIVRPSLEKEGEFTVSIIDGKTENIYEYESVKELYIRLGTALDIIEYMKTDGRIVVKDVD